MLAALSEGRARLRPTETVVKNVTVDMDALKQSNPALHAFYCSMLDELAEDTRPEEVLRVRIGNTVEPVEGGYYRWTLGVKGELVDAKDGDALLGDGDQAMIRAVTFDLHPTFSPASVACREPPFTITRRGWGTFKVGASLLLSNGETVRVDHRLSFSEGGAETVCLVPVGRKTAATTASTVCEGNSAENPEDRLPRMEGVLPEEMHGFLGDPSWKAPILTTRCDAEARPGYNTMRADEFNEDPATLRVKVQVLANMIRASANMVAYTGAGISTASGIGDYATKAKNSAAMRNQPKLRSNLDAQPTLAHCVLTALAREGHLKHWVQQNHDGLPQKAGFPQSQLNEIHGSWFEPSNPVVPMSGTLRGDLIKWLVEWEEKTDLCLAMGTSLCGMNADRMVATPGEKAKQHGVGLGAVIVGIQRTAYDSLASLRIFAKIDEVMALLAWEMQLSNVGPAGESVRAVLPAQAVVGPHRYRVPYHTTGAGRKKAGGEGRAETWDLRPGRKVRVTSGPGKGFTGEVVGQRGDGHYRIALPVIREGDPKHGKGLVHYLLGEWWVHSAVNGLIPQLPVVNVQ
mmetsp:Transcript_2729/g.7521  ORF Transcript_2729/g.7521 Transcript_2729/m.7521 type:complete len:573 (-) Transcript_2729:63-1781(-)